jgi:hypothetical protein
MSVDVDRTTSQSRAVEQTGGVSEDFPNGREGVRAGIVGASIVAVFFLAIDLAAERPLATPNALGAALFLGEPIDLARALSATLVLGYTAAHGTVFVGIAAVAASVLLGSRRRATGGALALGTWLGLFAVCELVFFALALLTGVPVSSALGAGRVAVANALAAGGMTASLVRGLRRLAPG